MAQHKINPAELPGNSRSPKLSTTPKLEAVAKGRKQKERASLSSTIRSVINDLFVGFVIPSAWNMLYEFANRTLIELIPGQQTRFPSNRFSRGPVQAYTSYNMLYDGFQNLIKPAQPQPQIIRAQSGIVDVGSHGIFYETENEARMVLAGMIERIAAYRKTTLGDFLNLSGLHADMTHQNYYWTDLTGAEIISTTFGWTLKLPPYKYSK